MPASPRLPWPLRRCTDSPRAAGNALLAHGIISRPTQDVDLFTNQEHGVEAAAGAVEAALRDAGFDVEREEDAAGLADIFPGMGEGLAEWVVTAPGGQQLTVHLAYFDRGHEPVVMEIGPVLDLQDVAGGKVCALASRVEPRDYADTAWMLESYSPAALIGFAQRLDPGLTARGFADAGRQLDQIDDDAFARYGLTRRGVAALRDEFAAWPRTPQAATARPQDAGPADPRTRQPNGPDLTSDGNQSQAADMAIRPQQSAYPLARHRLDSRA